MGGKPLGLLPCFRSPGIPGGPIEKRKRSFMHYGFLKLSYKFHWMKIVGLDTFGASARP